jgi:soluble lytic murein transglycosylase-like protein
MRVAAALGACVLTLACHAPMANAELWGYIDEAGVAHFATERLDDRYQLFFKGRSSLDANREDPPSRDARAALEQSPLYRRVVAHPNVRRFASMIERNAQARSLDPALVKAVIAVESAFEPDAVSAKGAVGLMQIVPATGARYGLIEHRGGTVAQQLLDPAINVRIGARYLRDLLELFDNDLSLALAAYNAGEESVRQNGNRIPPFRETQAYVALVRQFQTLYEPGPNAGTSKVTRIDLHVRNARSPENAAP